MADKNEIRFEADAQDVAVLDGYCVARGKNRTAIMSELLKNWAAEKHREAILICRVAGCEPTDADSSGGTKL